MTRKGLDAEIENAPDRDCGEKEENGGRKKRSSSVGRVLMILKDSLVKMIDIAIF
jgi:hypothetical protein